MQVRQSNVCSGPPAQAQAFGDLRAFGALGALGAFGAFGFLDSLLGFLSR
jgi:hypothetical protein